MHGHVEWQEPATHPTLVSGQVHLWRVSLHASPAQVAGWQALLSPDERERAARFYFERDRRRYTVARSVLRRLLGAYLRRDPSAVRFVYADKGKPSLDPASGWPDISFNLSHAGDVAVVALCTQGRIGVDIEQHRPLDDLPGLARTVFSPQELRDLNELPSVQRQRAFYDCWTRKEAFIKAIGDGLSYPLAQFDVTLRPDAPAQLLRVADEPDAQARWQMASFPPGPDYSGALVVEGQGHSLSFWRCAG